MVEHRNVHRRNAVCSRAFLLLDRRHHLHGIELLQEDHRRAMVDAAHHAEYATETVEKRHGNAHAVAAGEVLARADPEAIVADVAVRQLHALREARRSARVLHVHDVVDIHRRLPRKVVGVTCLARKRLHLVERIHAAVLFAAEKEHALQVRILRALERTARTRLQLRHELVYHLHVVTVAEPVDDKEVLRL